MIAGRLNRSPERVSATGLGMAVNHTRRVLAPVGALSDGQDTINMTLTC
jgi:hypothetical protein